MAKGGDQIQGTWNVTVSGSGGSGGSGTISSGNFTTSHPSNTGMWTSVQGTGTITTTFPIDVHCLVCDLELGEQNETGIGLCELCRQAIVRFRHLVLKEMAVELMEMVEDPA